MGIVKDSRVDLTYNKEVKPIETGIEKILRGSFTMAKSCMASWTLEQYDIDTMSILSGLSITAVGAIGGKLNLGTDDIVEKALLFTGTNKVDGKEHQMYSKRASIAWSIETSDDSRVIKVDARMYSFLASGETVEGFVTVYVLD